MLTMPKTQYAKADDGAHIAYQVVGKSAARFDIILIPPWASHVELGWENPGWVAFYAIGWIADLPTTRDSILADARRIGADVLVADARAARGDRPEIAPWLDPANAPPGWRPLRDWPGENALVLYGRENSSGSMR